jgi:alanine dehydrogenase
MNIGVINESQKIENRAGLTPSGVSFVVERGHTVYVQAGAGLRAGYSNEDYANQGAKVVFTKEEVFGRSDVVLNISPLNEEESRLVKEEQILFGFHHLAVAKKPIVEEFLRKKVTMIGYEIVMDEHDGLPFLESMGEVAGQLCSNIAGHYLQTQNGGLGTILGGVVSVPPATAFIVGTSVLAKSAAKAMLNAGAHTIVAGLHMDRMHELEGLLAGKIVTIMASKYNLARLTRIADVLIGAVLRPGERAPIMISRDMVKTMKKGAVIIDLAIDQGGCIETSRPCTLDHPVYIEEGVLHYCVPNLTASVSRTSTKVLSNHAIFYLTLLGEHGLDKALKMNEPLCRGLYIYRGGLVRKNIAERFGLPSQELEICG